MNGGWAAIGIATVNQTQNVNDTLWNDVTTAAGTYGIVINSGNQHNFYNYYDRSAPATATVWNHGGGINFYGGEDTTTGAVVHLLDNANSSTTLYGRIVTGSSTPNCNVSAGTLTVRNSSGVAFFSGTAAISGSGVLDISDPALVVTNLTVTGSAGTLIQAQRYYNGSNPNVSGWSGITNNPVYPAVTNFINNSSQTTTQTITWNIPAGNVVFEVLVWIRVVTAGTSTVPVLAYTQQNGNAFSQTLPMWLQNSAATTPTYTLAAGGTYVGKFNGRTDTSGTSPTVTITPTGSTFQYEVSFVRMA